MRSNSYNSRISQMPNLTPRTLRAACYVFILLIGRSSTAATTWEPGIQQLVRKILTVTGPGATTLELLNRSSLSKNEFDQVSQQISSQMVAGGARFVGPEQAAAAVQVTLSENIDSYVWIAKILQGTNDPAVVMISLPRTLSPVLPRNSAEMTLYKTLLWSQTTPIVDVAVLEGSMPHLVILEPEDVSLYKFQGEHWQVEQTFPVPHTRPWPRDLRGRIITRKERLFEVYLPGVFCESGNTTPVTVRCRESDDSWPLGSDIMHLNAFFAPTRNFFTGVLVPGVGKQTSAPAFYTAAGLPRDKYVLWLFATVSGQIHILDGVSDQTAGVLGWGDDIASIKTSCGTGWQLLASGSGDGNNDQVRAYEMADREPTPVSQSLEVNGKVTALWAATDGTTAFGVSRNFETGRYEAFRLSISCTQ